MPFISDISDVGIDESSVAPEAAPDERVIENELRPKTLQEFIGQDQLKEPLRIFVSAALSRNEPLDHVLLYGNPGLGKTTLAHIMAAEMGRTCKITSGPALEKIGDLAALLTSLETGDILFIDEIHRLNRNIEEILYPAMEDFALDLVIGKGPGSRTLRMQINKFTLIGATTRLSLLSSPLRDRFGTIFHLDFYTEENMVEILRRSSRLLGLTTENDALELLATATRRTPRVANRLLRRVRDVAEVEHAPHATENIVRHTLEMLRVDHRGLDHGDRRLLQALVDLFNGGPVGLSTLAAAIAEEIETVETVHEPYLLQIGFLERTPKGRIATRAAYEHLGRKFTNNEFTGNRTLV